MPNNFRTTGSFYMSKDGNDANPGTDPNAGKATVTRYGAGTHVIGNGVYEQAFAFGTSGAEQYNADGISTYIFSANGIVGNFLVGQGIAFNTVPQSLMSYIVLGSFQFRIANYGGTNTFNRMIFEGGGTGTILTEDVFATQTNIFNKCVFSDLTLNLLGVNVNKYINSKIFNSTISGNITDVFDSTDVDAATVVTLNTYLTTPATQFVNCNFRGAFNVGGTFYELKKDKNGNAIDPNPLYTDLAVIDATVYDRGNFSQDPLYQNLPKREYWTVAATSPNILAGTAQTNIGNVLAGVAIKVSDPQLSSGATVIDLIISSGDYIYDTGAGSGFGSVESDNIEAFPIAQQVSYVIFAILLSATNTLEAIGSAKNKNYPSTTNYAPGTAGANPRRYQYEMMWTDAANAPTLLSEYTNNGYFAADTYAKMQMFDVPRVDINGIGNGDPAFIPTGSAPILAKHIKAKITLLEGAG